MSTSEERRLDTQLPNWREYLRLGGMVVEEREAVLEAIERIHQEWCGCFDPTGPKCNEPECQRGLRSIFAEADRLGRSVIGDGTNERE